MTRRIKVNKKKNKETQSFNDYMNAQRALKFYGLLDRHIIFTKKQTAQAILKTYGTYAIYKTYEEMFSVFCGYHKEAIEEYKKEFKEKDIVYKERKTKILSYQQKAKEFYKSREWRELRYTILQEQKGKCQLCGRSAKDGIIIHIDHVKPLSKHWELRLDRYNLQCLCEDCNLGKSNKDDTNWIGN